MWRGAVCFTYYFDLVLKIPKFTYRKTFSSKKIYHIFYNFSVSNNFFLVNRKIKFVNQMISIQFLSKHNLSLYSPRKIGKTPKKHLSTFRIIRQIQNNSPEKDGSDLNISDLKDFEQNRNNVFLKRLFWQNRIYRLILRINTARTWKLSNIKSTILRCLHYLWIGLISWLESCISLSR
jgi:hypothetical protein